MNKRKVHDSPCLEKIDELLVFRKSHDQDHFYKSLVAAKDMIMCHTQKNGWNLLSSSKEVEQNNVKAKLVLNSVQQEPIPSVVGSEP